MTIAKKTEQLLYLWYLLFFVSIICCFRAVSSIAIALILLTGLVNQKANNRKWFTSRKKNIFLFACCLFYIVQLFTLLYATDTNEALKYLQTKSAMVFVPLAICSSCYLNRYTVQRLMKQYIGILAAMLLFCLLAAAYGCLFQQAGADVFFYHALVRPFHQHAVQVSIYTFAGLLYLLEKAVEGEMPYQRPIHYLLIFYFTGCLLLLSSKLIISFAAGCFIYYLFLFLKGKRTSRFIAFASLVTCLAGIVLVLSVKNRISDRFNEIISGNIGLFEQRDFNPGVYFNGLQFRLLQWRFVKEILTERHAWFHGVADQAQPLLNQQYVRTHMFTGNAGTASQGYLNYNTHNEWLESLLQSGITGLLAFLFICSAMVFLCARTRWRPLTLIVLLLIAYCFNESVLETQYGATLFTFFPLFFGLREQNENERAASNE